jgi:hypothetical protein
MTLEAHVYDRLMSDVHNACCHLEFNKRINSLCDIGFRAHIWNHTFRRTFYNVNDFLRISFLRITLTHNVFYHMPKLSDTL